MLAEQVLQVEWATTILTVSQKERERQKEKRRQIQERKANAAAAAKVSIGWCGKTKKRN